MSDQLRDLLNVIFMTGAVDQHIDDKAGDQFEIVHDLETLDTRHSAVVATIGAVCVRIHPDGTHDLAGRFYARVESNQYARTIDNDTISWWADQPLAAQAEISGHLPRVSLYTAIKSYAAWLAEWPTSAGIWAKGSDFDNAIMQDCFQREGKRWDFRRNRCLRTLLTTPQMLHGSPISLPRRHDSLIPHHALHDAYFESTELVALLHHLRGLIRH